MNTENPYFSKKYIINNMSKEERLALKQSLFGKTIKIIVNPEYGLFTEHGFPVAKFHYSNEEQEHFPKEFYAKVIQIDPIITVDDYI